MESGGGRTEAQVLADVDQGEFAGGIGGVARHEDNGGKADEVDDGPLGSEALDE